MPHKKKFTITCHDSKWKLTRTEHLTVKLSEPFTSIVPPRFRAGFSDKDCSGGATLSGARQLVFTAAAQLIFMDVTGLRIPTKRNQSVSVGGAGLGFDHRNTWIDRETNHVFTTNEPYWYIRLDAPEWAAENGYRLETPSWPGMWNPPRGGNDVQGSTVFQIIGSPKYPHWDRLLDRINSISFTPAIAHRLLEDSAVPAPK